MVLGIIKGVCPGEARFVCSSNESARSASLISERKVSGIAGPNLSSQGFASEFNYSFLTDRTVTLAAPYSAVDLVSSIRIRIWTYCDVDSGDGEPRTK